MLADARPGVPSSEGMVNSKTLFCFVVSLVHRDLLNYFTFLLTFRIPFWFSLGLIQKKKSLYLFYSGETMK
jgi:hypothetical protein